MTFIVPPEEINTRITRFQKKLQEAGLDAALIVQRVDLFYFSGTAQNAFLYLPHTGEPLLLVKKYLPRAKAESGLKNLIEIKSVKELPTRIREFYGKLPKTIGLELDVMPVKEFHFYQNLFPRKELKDCSAVILKIRAIKSPWEIVQLENTADLAHKTFEYLRTIIRPGISTMELGTLLETFARQHGHSGKLRVRDFHTEAYPWRILDSHGPLLQSNQPILIKLATMLNGYHISESRMVVMGSLAAKAQAAHQALVQIHNAVLEKTKPGLRAHAIFEFAVSEAKRLGYADLFPGPNVKFAGHGIGTELIEPPFLSQDEAELLQPGMCFTLEPQMVFKDEFITGLASVFQITETGTLLLTKIPPEIQFY
jgi:Xaa-Pro aminopeptidase